MPLSKEQIETNEIVKVLPELSILHQTAEEEVEYLWEIIGHANFYREHNYNAIIPDTPLFQELFRTSPKFGEIDKGKVEEIYVQEIYRPEFYSDGIARLEESRQRILSAFTFFSELHKKWSFIISSKYNLKLTAYGPGGSYDEDTNTVVMRTDEQGNFLREDPAQVPIHEFFHIGIEDLIVEPFKLSHLEKERLVDLSIIKNMKHLLPQYEVQPFTNAVSRIDSYVDLENLPVGIGRYVLDYPR